MATIARTVELPSDAVRRALRHELVVDVLVPFLASRLGLALVGYLAMNILVPNPAVPVDWRRPTDNPLIDPFVRWDAHWYLEIVRNGYTFDPNRQSSVAFFPLYPMLGRGLTALLGLGGSDLGRSLALLIVSNTALLAGAAVLHRFVKELYGRADAARAVLLLMIFPTTVFLSAPYPEALFLALSVIALHEGWHGRWWTAGVVGAAVALTRPFGVLIVVPLVVEFLLSSRGRALFRREALALALPFLGLAVYGAFLWRTFGDPLAFAQAQGGWERDFGLPWTAFQRMFDEPLTVHRGLHSAVDLAGGVFAVGVGLAGWRWLRPSHAALVTVVVLSILMTGHFLSIWRFLGSLFPVMILLTLAARHPLVDRSFRLLAPTVAGLVMAMFAAHYWVA